MLEAQTVKEALITAGKAKHPKGELIEQVALFFVGLRLGLDHIGAFPYKDDTVLSNAIYTAEYAIRDEIERVCDARNSNA